MYTSAEGFITELFDLTQAKLSLTGQLLCIFTTSLLPANHSINPFFKPGDYDMLQIQYSAIELYLFLWNLAHVQARFASEKRSTPYINFTQSE